MSNEQIVTLVLKSGVIGIIVLALLVIFVPIIIAKWKLFKKAGKKGWEALIPYYNTWILVKISELNWWYFLIIIICTIISFFVTGWLNSIAEIVIMFVNFLIFYNIAKKMKQNEIVYAILGLLFPSLAILILGFSKACTFDNNISVSPNGIIGDSKKQ